MVRRVGYPKLDEAPSSTSAGAVLNVSTSSHASASARTRVTLSQHAHGQHGHHYRLRLHPMFIIIMRVEFLDCCSGDDHGQPINAPALMQEEYIEIEKKATPFTRYR
eukprot:643973-Prymnesium_polylepis.1